MTAVQFFNSFRGRLVSLLAALLLITLGIQYYLNLRAERHTAQVVAEQEQALAAGVELGVRSISSTERMIELRDQGKYPLLSPSAGRVTNILVVDNEWKVDDSLDPNFLPLDQEGGKSNIYLSNVPLPPLVNSGQISDEILNDIHQTAIAPNLAQVDAPRAFPFPVQTSKGIWYVIVILGSANTPTSFWNSRAARPLIYTLFVLLTALLAATVLVWRFTQPITQLSAAARRVAQGDFDFKVPAENRRDEMGALARVFNEMISKLGRTRELEAKLHQVEQSAVVGRLASAIAHEIRNPLNYINLTLDHLRNAFAPEDPKKRPTFDRLAVQLKAEVARINSRITEFLNYTRPSTLELSTLDLKAEAEDALRMVEVDAKEHGVETSVTVSGELPQVLGDSKTLRSVLTNLIINSMHAMDGAGGRITIALSAVPEESVAKIEVTDTGPGIPLENISKIFEPYFSTKETGTGLGLAIVKKAVEDHGGSISVHSNVGEGTTFTITLPATEPAGQSVQTGQADKREV